MRKILSIFAAALVAVAVNAQTDFAAPGYSCAADAAVLSGSAAKQGGYTEPQASSLCLVTADPNYLAWKDVSTSSPDIAVATWTITATRGCYVSVSLDLGSVIIDSNKHIFEVKIKDDKGNVKGTLAEPAENTDAGMVKVLDGTILIPTAGTYTVELRNNRSWGKGAVLNVILTYAADAPSEIIDVTGVQLNKSELALEMAEVELLIATVTPDNATDPTVTWESSVPAVATVSEEGFVTAIAEGQTVISAKAGDITATCLVSVSAVSIPDVDFYAPCVLSAKKAQTEGAIWKMYTNDAYKLYGEGGHNKNYGNALWTINVTRPCIVSGMLNGVEGGHLFELDLYKGEELVATIAHPESKAWSKGEIALEGTLTFDEATVYTLKLRNTQEWSSGKVAGITLTYEADAPAPAHTYTVAGSSAVLFGTAWTPSLEANDMVLQEDNTYKWEKTDLELAAGAIEFKVCEDHAWTVAYPAQNYVLNIAESGIYTISIFYNPNDNNYVGALATKTGDAVVIPTVAMHGNFLGSWDDTENFTIAEGDATASLTLTLAEGNYEFGMRIGGSGNWTSNGVAFTRENNAAEVVAGQGNLTLAADVAGEYTFVWTYETNNLAITFPAAAQVADEWDEIIFEEAIAADDIAADASFTVEDSEFAITITDPDNKMAIDLNNCRFGIAENYTMYHGRLKSGGKSTAAKNFMTANIPAAGKLRIAVRTGKNTDTDRNLVIKQGESEFYNQAIVESMAIEVQEGDNTVNVYPFVEVEVAAGSVLLSYPTNGLNFYSFAFKADGSTSGITNTEVGEKAVKVFQNGQLMIIKNGVKYNVLGMTL